MAFQARADADQEVDARPCDHPRDTAVELAVGKPALRDVRQDERTAAVQRHAVQVIECQRQRIEVEVIGVVDQDRIVDALLHLETHGHRGRRGERRRGIVHRGAERLDDLGIAARCGVADDRLRHLGERRGIEGLAVGETRRDHAPQRLVIAVVDDFRGIAGQHHFLVALLLEIEEILLMRVADRGKNNHVGTDDAFQPLHLAGLRNARLEDRQLLVAFEHQHREGHAQLRIVAFRRAVIFHPRGQFFGDPLLDDGLAVRTGDADDRTLELRTVVRRKALQGVDGVVHTHEAATGGALNVTFDEERTHAARRHLGDEAVRVVVGTAHGHEHRAAAQFARQRAAVGDDRPHFGIAACKFPADNGGYFREFVVHPVSYPFFAGADGIRGFTKLAGQEHTRNMRLPRAEAPEAVVLTKGQMSRS